MSDTKAQLIKIGESYVAKENLQHLLAVECCEPGYILIFTKESGIRDINIGMCSQRYIQALIQDLNGESNDE